MTMTGSEAVATNDPAPMPIQAKVEPFKASSVKPSKTGVRAPATGAPDMERVRKAIADLNALADGGPGEIVRRRDGSHGFATPALHLSSRSLMTP